MKKLLLALILVFLGIVSQAQTASGSCKLPGTYDYVNVDYYEDGHLAVSNQSGMVITQLHITVTCKGCLIIDSSPRSTHLITLVDQTYYDIAPNQTTIITEGVKCSEAVERTLDDGRIVKSRYWDFQVEVGNAICK